MKLKELKGIQYHDRLNPSLWENNKLKPEIRKQLLKIADAFVEFLDLPGLDVKDIIMTGSNANYNWTSSSDIDLHIVVDPKDEKDSCPVLIDEFLRQKKALWNDNHDITIDGHDVELYAQDINEPHHASGTYSVQDNRWISSPKHRPPSIHSGSVLAKVNQIKGEINDLILQNASAEDVDKLKEKIRKFRQSGLEKAGEYSTENIAFKVLRNQGYLDRLSKYKRKTIDKTLSM